MKFLKNKLLIAITIISILLLIIIVYTYQGKAKAGVGQGVIGGVFSPVQSVFYNTGEYFKNSFSGLYRIKNLKSENERLKQEVLKLQDQNRSLSQMALENNRLRMLLDYKQENPQYTYIGVKITGKDPGNWFHVYIINKGANAGIETNDAVVVGQGYLVGKIIEVGSNYSKLMVLIDERSSASIVVNRTRDQGIVSGSSDSGITAVMPIEADIVKGDEIVTSVFSTYPAGLYVGKVFSVEKQEKKLQKFVVIESAVDFSSLEEVFVIKYKK